MAALINICSASRSGSTMLDLMLGNAPDAFSCGEVYAWFRPWRKHHFQIDCACGRDPCPIWEEIKSVPESQFHSCVASYLDVNQIIDSSKDLCWIADSQGWADAAGMEIYNLLLWKNPVDLSFSYWKRGGDLNRWRDAFVDYYTRFFSLCIPFLSVNYNELVQDPARKLEEICNKVNMSYFPGKERFWNKEHHFLFGSGGVRKQIAAGESGIRLQQAFPDEFLSLIPRLESDIQSDYQLNEILSVLRDHDVSRACYPVSLTTRVRRVWPTWYYVSKTKRFLRRYFPQPANISSWQPKAV